MAPAGSLRSKLSVASGGLAEYYGDGAMIGACLRTETPENAGAVRREINRAIAFGVVARAALANALAAAVVVGDQVVTVVGRIVAGANPRNWRGLGARRAGRDRATAAGTERSTQCTVTPVFTALVVADFLNGLLGEGPRDWQQG